jgi:hypothetical protein
MVVSRAFVTVHLPLLGESRFHPGESYVGLTFVIRDGSDPELISPFFGGQVLLFDFILLVIQLKVKPLGTTSPFLFPSWYAGTDLD